MDRIPILKFGNALLVTIQVDMHDRLATALEEDLTSKIVDVNAKACAMFGYTREQFRGVDVGTLGTSDCPYAQQDMMALVARAAAGEEVHVEWHNTRKDGTPY